MDVLIDLDRASGMKFGIVKNDNPHFLKLSKEDLYVLNLKNKDCDIITIRSEKKQILDLEFIELEIEANKTYYISPPPSLKKLESFTVNKFIRYSKCYETNVEPNQMEYNKNVMIGKLKKEIGSEKLKLSYWPFNNLHLSDFLENCGIEHIIVIISEDYSYDEYFLYNPTYIRVESGDRYSLPEYFDKIEDVSTNGRMFCTHDSLQKKIEYTCERLMHNGSSLTSGSDREDTETHNAFVIFNPKTPTNVANKDRIVLPIPRTTICGGRKYEF